MPIATVNRATGETVQNFEPHNAAGVNRPIIQAADADAAAALPSAGFTQRAAWMDVIESDIVWLAGLLTLRMGRPMGDLEVPDRQEKRTVPWPRSCAC